RGAECRWPPPARHVRDRELHHVWWHRRCRAALGRPIHWRSAGRLRPRRGRGGQVHPAADSARLAHRGYLHGAEWLEARRECRYRGKLLSSCRDPPQLAGGLIERGDPKTVMGFAVNRTRVYHGLAHPVSSTSACVPNHREGNRSCRLLLAVTWRPLAALATGFGPAGCPR